MKKMFLILGVIGGLCAINGYALPVGETVFTNSGWLACQQGCGFARNAEGGYAVPWRCVDSAGIECGTAKPRLYDTDNRPTEWAAGSDEPVPADVKVKDVSTVVSKKSDKTSVARVARTPKTANKTVSTMPKVQDKLGGVVLTYRCPEGCTSSNAGGSSGQTNGAFVASCVDAAGNECEVIWEVTETNTSASPARAAKVGPKVKQDSTNLKPVTPKVQDMAADGGAVAINCPAGCTPDCAILGNTVLCECKTSNGSTCKAEVVVADDTTVLK